MPTMSSANQSPSRMRDDVVAVGREGGLRHLAQVVVERFALIGEDQAGLVEGVAAEHAADGVAEEFAHGVGQQAGFELGFVWLPP